MERTGRTRLAPMALFLALMPGIARAESFVLAPLDCPDAEASANVTSLISAELEFQPAVDSVKEIGTEPSGSSCLGNTSCLGGLMRQGGGERLVTGTLSTSSTVYRLDLVYFDGSRVLKRQQFELPANPIDLADGMTAVVRDLLKTAAAAEEEATAYAFGDDEEDVEVDKGPSEAEIAAAAAAAETTRKAEAERRETEERRVREEAAKVAAAEAARREAETVRMREDAARRLEQEREAAAAPVFDPNAITFHSAKGQIKVESAEEIQFARPTTIPVSYDTDDAYAEADPDADRAYGEDLDDQDLDARASRAQSSPSKADRPKPDREGRHRFSLVARGGYSRYFQLGFITYGGELHVPLGQSGLYAIAGAEAYSVNRTLPAELQEQLGRTNAWDTIFPFNAGLLYKVDNGGMLVPYMGADGIFGQYYVDPETDKSYWTMGARARLGLDIYFTRVFGLDINASAGFWHGGSWEVIDQGMKNTGFLPQISAGAAFRF